MSDPAHPDLDKRIMRLLNIANTIDLKLDSLTFTVSEISQRLETLEERLASGNAALETDSERLTQIEDEIDAGEQERAALRNPANMISFDELSALLK